MRPVRVRFAPSPTGALHIGGVRTALYNYLFAKKNNGTFIIRIEDTDQGRYVEGAEKYIFDTLDWCGISPTESPIHGGNYGPYRQSERKPMYMQYALKMVEEGNAYYAFDTPEELDEMRERLKAARVVNPQYNSITRMQMKNSLTLPDDEVKARLSSGEPYVIRIKIPRKEEVRLKDMIRGWVKVHSSTLDDKVLMKSDGMPTYHLANIVDDHLMEITHVIRGEEWLPSAPLHVLLYQYLGWEDTMPEFAHLPLILKPDGNGKLSKRDAEQHGFPIFPMAWSDQESGEKVRGFKEDGYLKDALINFLAFLGWNPGDHREIFSLDELVEAFSIERIGKSGTKFDIHKAQWYNQQYIKAMPEKELASELVRALSQEGILEKQDRAEKIIACMKDRVTFIKDFKEQGMFFFLRPLAYDPEVVTKRWNDLAKQALIVLKDAFLKENPLDAESVKASYQSTLEQMGIKPGTVMQAVRLAITGEGHGPDLMHIIAILGAQEVAARIDLSIEKLG